MNQDYEQNLAKRATSDGEAHPEKEPISKQGKNPKKRSWRRTLISSMIFLLLGSVAGGSIYGWFFVQRKLIPLIETEAGNYLHRPLELGNLRSISLASASFGKSALPATEDNPDFVEVKQVKINFALLHFLRRRELKLDLILVKSNLYLEQDASKLWTPTDFGSDDSETGGIEVDVRSIQLDGGQMSLAAYNSATDSLNPPVTARIDRVVLRPRKDRIEFNVAANLLRGGRFTVIGRGNTETGVINLDFVARKLAAAEVSSLLALPIELNQGNLDGKLGVTLTDAPIPELHGELALDDVSMQVPGLVKPFSSSDGKVGFSGSMVELRKVTSNFGQVEAVASGSLDLADVGDYQIDAQVQPVTMPQVFEALELEAPVPVAGEIRGAVAVRGSLDNPLVKFDLATVGASRLDQLDFQQINADLELLGSTLAIKQLDSLPLGGGKIEGSGLLKLDSTESLTFNLRANRVSAKAIADSYEQDLPVDIGRISGQTNLTLQAGELSTLKLRRGTANFDLGNGIVKLDNLNYGNGRWSSRLTSQGVEFGSLPFGEGSTPTIAKGLVDGVFQVTGTKDFDDLSQLDAEGTGALKTVGGQVALNKIKIADGSWNTDAQTENLQLQQLFPELPDEFDDNLSGEFYLTGNIPDQAQPQTLINGFGDLILASGEVKVSDLAIVDQDWKAIAKGTNLRLKQLSSTTPDQFAGLIDGTLELSGTTDDITPEGIIALGDGSLTLPEGVFAAQELAIADGKFRAQVTPQEVDLELFADPNSDELELKGQLGGNLALTGNVDDLSPTAVAAKGRLTFSQGLDLLEQSFAAGVVWDGRRLDVKQAQGDGLNAQGHVVLDPSFFEDIPDKLAAVDYFEFDVTEARWLDVKKLRLNLPTWAVNLDYSGRGDFAGQISGNPSAMNIGGNVGLKDFKVEEVGFAPFLAGNVQISPKTGVKLSLQEILTNPLLSTAEESGSEAQPLDKIELVLDRNFAPLSMAIAQDTLLIEGTGNQEILDLKGQNIPVKLLKTIAVKSEDIAVPENLAPQALDGLLSGDFTFNLNTLATSGSNVIIEDPTLASVRGDRLEGDFQYADGYFGIQDVEFRQRNSIYKLDGNISQNRDDLELDGKISIDGGQIQDILVALQIFELSDFARIFSDRNYGDAEALYQPPSEPPQPLFNLGFIQAEILKQLELLKSIQVELTKSKQKRQQAFVPEIRSLQGTFDGQIKVFGSLNTGLTSEFDFLGEKWQWGKLIGERIVARGRLSEGILTLLPIKVELEDTTTSAKNKADAASPSLFFTGTFGGTTQSGQFKLVEVPVKLIEKLISIPPELALNGLVNATASIAGSPTSPQARGEISIDDASLNGTSIQSTKGSFNYKQSRLKFFASSVVAQDAEPVTLTGSIPYQLPFAEVKPESDRLELQLDVKDKGLAILDIFSQGELKWIDGQGEIALDITGILEPGQNFPRELTAQGVATINNATIAAKSLPKNQITNVSSQMSFDFDNIHVDDFQGDFGLGTITAKGTIPLRQDGAGNPLTISFNDIKKVELPKLYNGGVAGKLQILGTATKPDITGNLTLSEGTIVLASENETSQEELTITQQPNTVARRKTDQGLAAATRYKNLKLQLGKNIQISQPAIFTFTAEGKLDINGTFLQPSPEGTIVLQRGQVNLFTTQLNLSRDYENTARFSSNHLLNPFLDILLVGSTIEASDRSTPSELSPAEIPDSGLRALETIRVSAKVKGLASQITDRIELTSSPPRNPTEIAILLGGGFVEALGNSNSTAGLATLAGSALFGSLNAEFNNIFPIGEIRFFPTSIIDENRDDNQDGLAGEIAFELFDKLSFSVLKILNTDIPAQFGFRYRINDNFVLRGSSNFREESSTSGGFDGTRGLIEYELRF